jgi:hypothetical protein
MVVVDVLVSSAANVVLPYDGAHVLPSVQTVPFTVVDAFAAA